MSSADQRPYFIFENPEYNFEKFHIVIAICTVIGAILFILNIALGCCSRYSEYWNDAHTGKTYFVFVCVLEQVFLKFCLGNRWIVSLWTATPHRQPPLDYTELQTISVPQTQVVYEAQIPEQRQELQYLELKKRESEI